MHTRIISWKWNQVFLRRLKASNCLPTCWNRLPHTDLPLQLLKLSVALCYLTTMELARDASQFNSRHFHLLNNCNLLAYCKILFFQCHGHSLSKNHFYKIIIIALSTKIMHSKTMLSLPQSECTVSHFLSMQRMYKEWVMTAVLHGMLCRWWSLTVYDWPHAKWNTQKNFLQH